MLLPFRKARGINDISWLHLLLWHLCMRNPNLTTWKLRSKKATPFYDLKRDFRKASYMYKAIGDIAYYVILASGMPTFLYPVSLLRNKTLMIVRL